MNQMWIPEIGDTFVLAEDWKFQLQNERRNESAIEFLKADYSNYQRSDEEVAKIIDEWVDTDYEWKVERMENARQRMNEVENGKQPSWKGLFFGESGNAREDYQKWARIVEAYNREEKFQEYAKRYYNELKNGEDVRDRKDEVVIPKGSQLGVDRVYIRKGAKDFSSITFYLKTWAGTPMKEVLHFGKKVPTVRFWAKLSDVNKIKYEKSD